MPIRDIRLGYDNPMTDSNAKSLDARGLNCPMPLLKAKKAINELAPGDILTVVATDPGSVRDFRVFSEQSGHALLESREADGEFFYRLQKKAS